MATMLARTSYPRRCVCWDCGDPSWVASHHRLMKRSAKRREQRWVAREVHDGRA